MSQSRTLCMGMDVHKDSSAGASRAHDHGAAVTDLGALGPRQGARDQLVRKMQSKAPHLLCVYAAGPCGSGLSRSRTQHGSACWGGAPSVSPHTPGDRGTTDRRDAGHLARLARAGERTVVSVPPVAEEARRALPRARAETLSARQAATWRL